MPTKNPSLERMQRRNRLEPAYRRAPKQEAETVQRTKGRKIPASGSRFRKADTEVPGVARIECKATRHSSFRVTRGMMDAVEEAGIYEGQIPVIQVEFVDNVSNVLDAYCVVKRIDLENLIVRVADAEGTVTADKRTERRVEHHKSRLAAPKRERAVPDTRLRRPRERRP